jgi:hypothetical protein
MELGAKAASNVAPTLLAELVQAEIERRQPGATPP